MKNKSMNNTNNQKSVELLCLEWWRRTFGQDTGVARMIRAQLRRCSSPVEVLTIESVHDLNRILRDYGHQPSPDQLALIATVLADVENNEERKEREACKIATLFGRKTPKDGPRALSALRFQRIIHTRDRAQLITPLRRAMAIIRKNPINVIALARDLYYWNERTRNSWCFQYFGAEKTEPRKTQYGDQH